MILLNRGGTEGGNLKEREREEVVYQFEHVKNAGPAINPLTVRRDSFSISFSLLASLARFMTFSLALSAVHCVERC